MKSFEEYYLKTEYNKDGSSYTRAAARDAWDTAIAEFKRELASLSDEAAAFEDLWLKINRRGE